MREKSRTRTVLLCSCSNTELIEAEKRETIVSAIKNSGANIVHYQDLCESIQRGENLPSQELLDNLDAVVACFPRTVKWLLKMRNLTLKEGIEVQNMRQLETLKFKELYKESDSSGKYEQLELIDSKPAWFPVIDYSRCTSCRQCSSFCLFEVYEIEDKVVKPKNPQNCKNNCPACARICPEGAIIFPKSPESPINGEDILDEGELKKKIESNREIMLGEDIPGALRKRREKIKSRRLIKDKARDMALKEREKCSGIKGKNLFRMKNR